MTATPSPLSSDLVGALRALATLCAAALACASAAGRDSRPVESAPLAGDVLFIGNSLTAANDLPGMVQALAAAMGDTLRTEALVAGGASLEDHWRAGGAATSIREGEWSVVVLQQGPSTLEESRAHLIRWAGTFADEIRSRGAAPYLYMVWPPLGGAEARGIESYRLAALRAETGLFPVADAMRRARERDPSLALLAGDDFHPAPPGTYLAALVIVAQLLDRSPVGMPHELPGRVVLPAATAAVLQHAAAAAIRSLARRPRAASGSGDGIRGRATIGFGAGGDDGPSLSSVTTRTRRSSVLGRFAVSPARSFAL